MSSTPSESNTPTTKPPKPAHRRWSRPLWLGAFVVVATATFVVVATAVCLYWAWKPATYEASTKLRISRSQSFTLFPPEQVEAADPNHFAHYQQAQAEALKSRLVLNVVAKTKPNLSDPEREMFMIWLEDNLQVDFPGPETMRVRLRGNDPEELKKLLTEVVDTYLNEVVFKEHNKRLARIDQLKNIAQNYQAKLSDKKRALKELAKLAGAKNPKNLLLQQQILLEHISSAQKDLNALLRERRIQEIELKLLEDKVQALANAPIAEPVIREALEKDPVVREFLSREASLKVDLEKIKKVATPETFAEKSKEVARELKAVQDALEQHRKEVRPEVIKQLREKLLVETQEQIAALKTKMTFSEELQKRLTEDVQRWNAMNKDVNVQGLEIEGLNDDISQVEAIAKKALAEAEAMEVERHAPPRVNKLDPEPIIRKVR